MSKIPRKTGVLVWKSYYRFYCIPCYEFKRIYFERHSSPKWNIRDRDFDLFRQPCDSCGRELNPLAKSGMPILYPRYNFQNNNLGINVTSDRVMLSPEEFMRDSDEIG